MIGGGSSLEHSPSFKDETATTHSELAVSSTPVGPSVHSLLNESNKRATVSLRGGKIRYEGWRVWEACKRPLTDGVAVALGTRDPQLFQYSCGDITELCIPLSA